MCKFICHCKLLSVIATLHSFVKPVAVLGFLYPLHKRGATIVASRLAAGRSITHKTIAPLDSRSEVYVD